MKKLLSLLLLIAIMVPMIAIPASAADGEVAEPEYVTGELNFDTTTAGWGTVSKVFCHIWAYGGDSFAPWQSKKEACTDTDKDGIWTYDIGGKGFKIEVGQLYAVIFSSGDNQTYDLLFDSTVLGDTGYCDGTFYENPEDSTKVAQAAFWKDQDAAVFGPEKKITSIGNVVGTCVPNVTTAQGIFETFLADAEKLENVRTFSLKEDQAILDDIANGFGLTKEDVATAIANTGAEVAWTAENSTIENADVPATEAPTEAPATEAPTEAPATEAPTEAPATEAPTEAPATEAPTEAFDPADHTWTAVGAIAPGHVDGGIFGDAWNPANTANDLTLDETTGIWSVTYTDVAATLETEDYDDTSYQYKVAADHAWDISFNDKGNALGDGTNAEFDVAVDGSTVTIFFDGTKCWAEVEAPEVPVTEAPTEAPVTEAPTQAPATWNPEVPEYVTGVLNFDTTTAGWGTVSKVFCHIWVYNGDAFAPWQSKKEACTDADGDGIWTYDIGGKGFQLQVGVLYAVIFSSGDNQTYDLLFDSTVLGDTAYCDGTFYENPEDSTKTAQAAFWKGQNAAVFGPEKKITSIGNVVGTCIPNITTAQEIFEKFLADTEKLDNVRTFSLKEDQAILDDIAKDLGLTKEDVEAAIANTGAEVAWTAENSTLDAKPEFLLGDVSGDGVVDIIDATLIQMHAAKLETLTDDQLKAADTTKDGAVDVVDASTIQLFVAKLITEF